MAAYRMRRNTEPDLMTRSRLHAATMTAVARVLSVKMRVNKTRLVSSTQSTALVYSVVFIVLIHGLTTDGRTFGK